MPPDELAEEKALNPKADVQADKTELYQEGLAVTEPNAGNAVKGYDPSKDQRRQHSQ